MGGPALHVAYLTAGLRERGYDTTLVAGTLARGEDSMAFVADELGVPVLRIDQLTRDISPIHDTVAALRLARLIRRERPDILHTHTAKARAVGRLAAGPPRPPPTPHTRPPVPRPRPARLLRPPPHGRLPPARAPARARVDGARRRQPPGARRPRRARCRARREVRGRPARDRA